jgi:ATP-dependent RNA helicase HelY
LSRKRVAAPPAAGDQPPAAVDAHNPSHQRDPRGALPTLSSNLTLDPRVEADLDQFGALYPFPLDEFQREAIRTLLRGDSVMVAAPTGTGKTVVAEFAIFDSFKRAGRVIYTTPIKALSNQKYRDLRALYGDEVGLLTGDVSENRDARVVVMTTEVLRNMLLQTPWEVDTVESVIFDEIHFLADPERGTTWEESIILCPEHIQLVCLSATVTNAPEIAAWISRTHRPIRLITHTERAVPLSLYYFIDAKLHQVVDHTGKIVRDFPRSGGELKRQNGARRHTERADPDMNEPQPREIIDALAAKELLPAIYFLFSRNDCQQFAERLAVMRPHLVTNAQFDQIEVVIEGYLNALRPEDRELEQVKLITALARKGIGFHHAGLLPVLKQFVEVLFGRGLMQVVFATDTLALGVNMPARTVVIGRMSKWDGRRRRVLIPNEFQQMAGRAGRRGMDAFGHVVVPYSPWIAFRDMLEVATGPLEPVRSAFAVRYNTVLHLWDPPRGDRVRNMLQQSLAQFQMSQRIRLLEDDIIEISGDIAGIPQGCLIGLDAGDELLDDYRRLGGTLSAAQHRERRVREQLADLEREAISPPWPEPGRQALRRAFRYAQPGLVAHHRDFGWGAYVGRGKGGGVGLFLFGKSVKLVAEYRHIDYLTDGVTVQVPEELIEPSGPIEDVWEVVSAAEMAKYARRFKKLGLPDLEGLQKEHQERERERLASELNEVGLDLSDAMAQVEDLQNVREGHPCHACPLRKEHRDFLARIERLDKERQGLEEFLFRETEAEDERIRGVIWGIREVLHHFGYLRGGSATSKADMLAGIFDNDGLILCEMIDRRLLDRLSPDDLAEVFSWFSFDRDFRYTNHYTLPDHLVLLRRRLEDLEHAILGQERDNNLFISEGHNATFYGAAIAWCRGDAMADISEVIQLSEGDLVLTFNKTIDLMRQVRDMLIDVAPDNHLRWTLLEAERLLRRGIVEQSLTLGFAPMVLNEQPAEAAEPEPELEPAPESTAPPARPRRAKKADIAVAVAESAAEPVRRRRKTTPIESLPVVEPSDSANTRSGQGRSKQPKPA